MLQSRLGSAAGLGNSLNCHQERRACPAASALHRGYDPLREGDRQARRFNGAKARSVKLADKIANLRDVADSPPVNGRSRSLNCAVIAFWAASRPKARPAMEITISRTGAA